MCERERVRVCVGGGGGVSGLGLWQGTCQLLVSKTVAVSFCLGFRYSLRMASVLRRGGIALLFKVYLLASCHRVS